MVAFCKTRLANFKIPREILFVELFLATWQESPQDGAEKMNLELSESELAFQEEVRSWLRPMFQAPFRAWTRREGFEAHRVWEQKLFDAGLSTVSWPKELGGREASLVEWVIFEEEYYRAGAPGRVSQNGIFLLAPIIFEHGTPEQQQRFLPTMSSGEVIWAQAWSEPEAGSDLASLRSSATKKSKVAGSSTVRRPGRRERCTRTGASACSAATRRHSVTTA